MELSPDGTLVVQKQSRDHKQLGLISIEPKTVKQRVVLTEKQPSWVNLSSDLNFWMAASALSGPLSAAGIITSTCIKKTAA